MLRLQTYLGILFYMNTESNFGHKMRLCIICNINFASDRTSDMLNSVCVKNNLNQMYFILVFYGVCLPFKSDTNLLYMLGYLI